MDSKIKCLRCNSDMQFLSREFIRLGPQSILDAIALESLETDVYVCPLCRKLEFFATECLVPSRAEHDDCAEEVTCPGCLRKHEYGLMSCPYCSRQYTVCPECGRIHDLYLSFCPACRHEYRGKRKKGEKTESKLSKYL